MIACIAFLLVAIAGIVWLVVSFRNTSNSNTTYETIADSSEPGEINADQSIVTPEELGDSQAVEGSSEEESQGGLSPEGLALASGDSDTEQS